MSHFVFIHLFVVFCLLLRVNFQKKKKVEIQLLTKLLFQRRSFALLFQVMQTFLLYSFNKRGSINFTAVLLTQNPFPI